MKKKLKDVRAHCYCASLVRTLFIRHARATSFSSACTESKTQQNIELMTFVSTWCANIFVGCSVTPFFFRQITSFLDTFHYIIFARLNPPYVLINVAKIFFSIAVFLPRVLMCQKRQISLPVRYKTARPKTGDWERL